MCTSAGSGTVTTRHNLTQKFLKRVRMIATLSHLVEEAVQRETPLTPPEKRSMTIAMRNLCQATDDARRTLQALHNLEDQPG